MKDLCIWPDCDCEIRCDHINCSPPVQQTGFDKWLAANEKPKPRFRIYFISPGRVMFKTYRDPAGVSYYLHDTLVGVCFQKDADGHILQSWRPVLTLDKG